MAAVAGKNFTNGSNNPTPTNPDVDNHGTMVGGIAGAVGANNLGVRGVAPAATLKGFNPISRSALGNQQSNIEYAWWDGAESVDVQVFNNSWGAGPGNRTCRWRTAKTRFVRTSRHCRGRAVAAAAST